MLANLRADIHNTAGKSFDEVVDPRDLMPGKSIKTIEERAYELMKQGYAPAAAVAIASSKQDRATRQNIIQTTMDGARLARERRAAKPARGRKVKRAG